jgi:hypothetical protein
MLTAGTTWTTPPSPPEAPMRQKALVVLMLTTTVVAGLALARGQAGDARLKGAFRRAPVNGWTFVHLEGTPAQVGYQHGYLLASEIVEMKQIADLELSHDTKKDWAFFRDAARTMMWPRIEQEYRDELQGIADGVAARGQKLDLWDVVALNALLEWSYYVAEYDKQRGTTPSSPPLRPEHCSAFVATGRYTKDGKVVIAHNNWTSYLEGPRWTIVFDIVPSKGHAVVMDGLPGFIASDDDFGINAAGIMITETTITGFHGFDPKGIPEFVRARKAMQYAASIDEFARIMKDGNNGGYANDWLVADRNTNEIASLELGLKNVTLEKKTDGYFVGANFPINPKLLREETDFDAANMGLSANARRVRWGQLMEEHKGRIDVAAAQAFLADHYDTYQKKVEPNERTLCGHNDLSPRGMPGWQAPYAPAGAIQNKAADAAMAARMAFSAAAGHACGLDFLAAPHLAAHPEFAWQKPFLKDMKSQPWTVFEAAKED